MRKGLWSPDEDEKLQNCLARQNIKGCSWSDIARKSGLDRCGKSCRRRWMNHLRPELKRSKFTPDEVRLVIERHRSLGNKWSEIASHLVGRRDNDVKNLWNTQIKRHFQTCSKSETNSANNGPGMRDRFLSSYPFGFSEGSMPNLKDGRIKTNVQPVMNFAFPFADFTNVDKVKGLAGNIEGDAMTNTSHDSPYSHNWGLEKLPLANSFHHKQIVSTEDVSTLQAACVNSHSMVVGVDVVIEHRIASTTNHPNMQLQVPIMPLDDVMKKKLPVIDSSSSIDDDYVFISSDGLSGLKLNDELSPIMGHINSSNYAISRSQNLMFVNEPTPSLIKHCISTTHVQGSTSNINGDENDQELQDQVNEHNSIFNSLCGLPINGCHVHDVMSKNKVLQQEDTVCQHSHWNQAQEVLCNPRITKDENGGEQHYDACNPKLCYNNAISAINCALLNQTIDQILENDDQETVNHIYDWPIETLLFSNT